MYKRRLFVAINFDSKVKEKMNATIKNIRPYSTRGRFVKKENLHLTLEFLGEMEDHQVHEITEILSELDYPSFYLKLKNLGYFKERKGKLYWLGIEENETLLIIQNEIHQKLEALDFELESRPFLPHITIGRKIAMDQRLPLDAIEEGLKKIEIKVNTICLMDSQLIDGQLYYSIIHAIDLK